MGRDVELVRLRPSSVSTFTNIHGLHTASTTKVSIVVIPYIVQEINESMGN